MKTTPEIAEYLIAKDRKMKKIIGADIIVERPTDTDYFHSLVDTIVSQQVSSKVAQVFCDRLLKLCKGKVTLTRLKKRSDEEIRALGISAAKITYLRSLIEAIDKGVVHFRDIEQLSDEEVVSMLTKVKGIGPWSAEMFLIFSLEREDVYSTADLALANAVSFYYFKGQPVKKEELLKISKKWRPYRTYASFYLWNSIHRGLS